jgi:glycosyltransferase involved in cell wall biosynthesis
MATIAIDARIINSSTGRYVERLIHHLEAIDTTNKYLILVPRKDLKFYKPKNPNFKVVEADFDNYSFAEQLGFKKLLDQLKPDLVHFCMPQQPVLYRGNHVTTVHDLNLFKTYNSDKNYVVYKVKQFVGRFVFKAVGKSSTYILSPTNFVADEFAAFAHIPRSKIAVTYEGTDIQSVAPLPYDDLTNSRFIMYLGQQSDYKNIRRLMRAHQELRRNDPSLLLVLVGRLTGKNGPPLVTNKAWAEKQGFEGIMYTDYLPDEQVAWLYQNCLAYVFPSLMEGFGLPALEAMSCGAPLVSSNATCLPEVYGGAAEYFNPTDIADMTAAIGRVIYDPARRSELITRGAQQVQKYSWRKMAEETLDVYQEALAGKES